MHQHLNSAISLMTMMWHAAKLGLKDYAHDARSSDARKAYLTTVGRTGFHKKKKRPHEINKYMDEKLLQL